MNYVTGNAYDSDTRGSGWFIGFSEWTLLPESDLLHVPKELALSGLCVKWYEHPSGHDSGGLKPLSEGRSISILVTEDSEFEIDFSLDPQFAPGMTETASLVRRGDFAAWGEGLHHRWRCIARSTILTIRWNRAKNE